MNVLDPKLGGKLRLVIRVLGLVAALLAVIAANFPGLAAVAIATKAVDVLLDSLTHLSPIGNEETN